MVTLPTAIDAAFRLAAAELGMASAARLFVGELAAASGRAGVEALRDRLGRAYPVLDGIAGRWLRDGSLAPPSAAGAAAAIAGVSRLLVVGIEADALDVLLPELRGVEVGFVTEGRALLPEWRRVLANYERVEGVEAVGLGDFQLWAGRDAALLTFVYGGDAEVVHVSPQWLRVQGPDTRALFRSLVAWDVLGEALEVYPRWFAEAPRASFTEVVGG